MEVLGLYDVIRSFSYDLVLCLLAIRRSQERDWSRCGGSNLALFGYDFETGQGFDVPPLRASNRCETGSGTIVDVQSQEDRCL